MNTVETVEYHANCPSCGAVNNGTGVCDYCGASLVKSRAVAEHNGSLEELITQEDAGLPVIEGKSGEVSTFLKTFCPLFGGIFILVPTALFCIFVAVGIIEPWLVTFLGIFWIVGICSFVPLLTALSRRRKCLNGQRIAGTVRGYADGSYLINNAPVKIIRLRVDEGDPKIIELSTGDTRCKYAIGSKLNLMTDGICFIIDGVA